MRKAVGNIGVIKSDADAVPQGAEFTGEHVRWGGKEKRVFVESREIAEIVPRIDPYTKAPIYKKGPGGTFLTAMHTERKVIGHEKREFILDDMGNGQVIKVYTFREDPAEIERKAKVARRQKNLEALLDAAEEVGGADNLIDALTKPGKK